MKCWYCGSDTMTLREDERFWQCSECKATSVPGEPEVKEKKPKEKKHETG